MWTLRSALTMVLIGRRVCCAQERKLYLEEKTVAMFEGARDDQTEPCHLEFIFYDPCHPAPFSKPVSPNSQAQRQRLRDRERLPHVEVAGPRKDLGLVNGLKLDPGRGRGCSFCGPRLTRDRQLLELYHTEGMHTGGALLLSLPTLNKWGN